MAELEGKIGKSRYLAMLMGSRLREGFGSKGFIEVNSAKGDFAASEWCYEGIERYAW